MRTRLWKRIFPRHLSISLFVLLLTRGGRTFEPRKSTHHQAEDYLQAHLMLRGPVNQIFLARAVRASNQLC